jgi:RsiW-degrading membrane proteinase PrsW (M82 family)
MLRFFIYPRKHFDDPFDGIVYAVMIGMGFATIENVGYVMQHGIGTGILAHVFICTRTWNLCRINGIFCWVCKIQNN